MRITQDIHVHTRLSSCASRDALAAEYIAQAPGIGLDTIGFADHMWDSHVEGAPGWYVPQNEEHVLTTRDEVKSTDKVHVLVGCECEYNREGRDFAMSEETAKRLDFILVPNSHTHITYNKDRQDRRAHADYMMQAFYDIIESRCAKYVTSIAHPFCAVGCPYPPDELLPLYSDEDFYKCFKAAAKAGIAMELNPCILMELNNGKATLETLEPRRMFTIAKDAGCRFTYGSDRHSSGDYQVTRKLEEFAELCGITDNDMKLL